MIVIKLDSLSIAEVTLLNLPIKFKTSTWEPLKVRMHCLGWTLPKLFKMEIAFTQIIHWKCCMEFLKDTLKNVPIHYNAESATGNNIFKCREELPALCFLVLSGSS